MTVADSERFCIVSINFITIYLLFSKIYIFYLSCISKYLNHLEYFMIVIYIVFG